MSKGLGRLFWFNWVTSKVLHMLKKNPLALYFANPKVLQWNMKE